MENINQNETTSQTQSAQILKALKNGERLTHLDAEKRFNCLRLGARIYDLRKRGHNIISKMILCQAENVLLSIGWRLDMKRLFSPEFVASLDDREKILAYEAVKRELRERNASQEEYDRVTDQVIEELEI